MARQTATHVRFMPLAPSTSSQDGCSLFPRRVQFVLVDRRIEANRKKAAAA
jgi:hypothetical protein